MGALPHGDDSFDQLLRPLIPAGYQLAVAMLGDRGLAEDAVQEAALTAWRKLSSLRDRSAVRPWFLSVVANQCRSMRWRARRRAGCRRFVNYSPRCMRIAVVSDVHGHLVALDAVIEDLARWAPDVIVHGGDLAVIGPRPAEVVDRVWELGWPGVLGNTDEMLWDPGVRDVQMRRAPRIRDWLEVLFDTLAPWSLEQLGAERLARLRRLPRDWRHKDVLLTHASPGDLWRAPMPDADDEELAAAYADHQAALVVYGHIHRPFVRTLPGLTVANSGSVGLPYDGDWRPSYLLIEDGVPSVHRVEYDLERGMRDLVDSGFPMAGWLAENQRRGRFSRPSVAPRGGSAGCT